jgi:hypothetical protein
VTLVGTMETMHAAGRRSLPPVPRSITERPAPPVDRPEPDAPDAESPTERFVVDLATGEQRTVSSADAPEDDAAEVLAAADDAHVDDAPQDDEAEVHTAADDAEVDDAPVDDAPVDDAPVDDAPVDNAPVDEAPEDAVDPVADEASSDDASEDDASEDDAPTADAAEDDAPTAAEPAVAEPAVQAVPRVADADLDPAQEYVTRLRAAAADFAEAAGAKSAVVREAVPPARHRRARCRLVLRYADESEVDVTFLGPAGRPGTPSRHGFDRQIRRWLADGQHREDAWLVDDEDACDGLAVDLSAWAAAA